MDIVRMKRCIRPALHIFLAIIFFSQFGLPAIKRYLVKDVMTITTSEQTGGITAPSVTFVIRNQRTYGWKNKPDNGSEIDDYIRYQCGDSKDIHDCVIEKTYSFTEVVKDVVIGFNTKKSLMDPKLWKEDFTTTYSGRAHTITPTSPIGPDDTVDQLFYMLDSRFLYEIFIHDERFFIKNINAAGLPTIYRRLVPNSTLNYYYPFGLVEHRKLNLPRKPCKDDPKYNYEGCIKESLSKMFGCRLPWDKYSDQTRNICSTMKQYR